MDWYTGCQHFNHKKILRLSNRPFENIDEMNDVLIENISQNISRSDTLWILGDFCFGPYQDALKIMKKLQKCTKNIHLILGNHDKLTHTQYKEMGFCTVRSDHVIKRFVTHTDSTIGPRKIVLYHYPILEWDGYFRKSWHLHSHVHNTMNDDVNELRMNIGVDVMNFSPISFDHIRDIMIEREKTWDKTNRKHRSN